MSLVMRHYNTLLLDILHTLIDLPFLEKNLAHKKYTHVHLFYFEMILPDI